jgi:hypothetical protein
VSDENRGRVLLQLIEHAQLGAVVDAHRRVCERVREVGGRAVLLDADRVAANAG